MPRSPSPSRARSVQRSKGFCKRVKEGRWKWAGAGAAKGSAWRDSEWTGCPYPIVPMMVGSPWMTRQVEAKYLSVRVIQGEPTIMGTMGYGQPVHSESLHALSFAAPAPAHFHLPSFNLLQNPFDPRTERALDGLGDLGVQAEVYRLRCIAHQRLEVLHRRVTLQEETRQQCQRWEDLYALEESVDQQEVAVKECLKV